MIEPKNLLLVRTDRIGDVVLSLPLARLVKKRYPGCRITFLLRNYTSALAENHPYIDDILILHESKDGPMIGANIKAIASRKFDSAVIVYPTFVTALIIYLSNIKNRIGTGYRWYSFLFNRKVYAHRKYADKHELEFNVDLLKMFGIEDKVTPEEVKYDLLPDPQSLQRVDNFLTESGINADKPLIIMHPGSGGSAVDWPAARFRELAELMSGSLNANIVVTGSKSEEELCGKLIVSGNMKNLAGIFDLKEMIALISKADVFIANSTGPIHIAAALGKQTIGFYPKILACSQERWGPYSAKRLIFTPQIDCSNCSREQCEKKDCMNSIKAVDVYNEIEKIFTAIAKNGEKDVE